MVIENIKYHKNNADISVGGVTYNKVSLLILAQFGFKKDMEISQKELGEFLSASEKSICKDKLITMLSSGAKTEKEARNKLYLKGFSKDSVELAIATAKSYGYISDTAYADSYATANSYNKGSYRIRQELRQKGVAEEVINSACQNIKDGEQDSATSVAEKFFRNKASDPKIVEKLFRHLASRGYGYDTIKEAIAALHIGVDYED